jgi:predicted DsbA family dithiol-disulfide isomerase
MVLRLRVDVVSDVICPWCFVGKRRLEKALRALPARAGSAEPEVIWHPFELNPEMPRDGIDRRAYREAKFGSLETSRGLDARLAAVGLDEGIAFAFERIHRTPNTFDAHRLIWLAQRESVQEPVVEGLFRKYFLEGEDIGRRAILLDVAIASGLARDQVERFLEDRDGIAAVRQAEAEAWNLGIHGVPHFIVNGEYSISGAQRAEVFAGVFERALNREVPTAAAPGRGGTGGLGEELAERS